MASEGELRLKNGSVVKFVETDGGHKFVGSGIEVKEFGLSIDYLDRAVYDMFAAAKHVDVAADPVIYPDESFDDYPDDDEDFDDDDTQCEDDDMVPVYPAGVAIPADAVIRPGMMVTPAMAGKMVKVHSFDCGCSWCADWRNDSRLTNIQNDATASILYIPTTKSELDSLRESIKELPDGLKAVIYNDLYNQGLRVTDVVSAGNKIGAAEKYIKGFES